MNLLRVGQVDLRPELGSSNVETDHVLIWKWCNVLHRGCIPLLGIYNSAQRAVLLGNDKHRCRLFRSCRAPPTCLAISVYLLGEGLPHRVGTLWQVVIALLLSGRTCRCMEDLLLDSAGSVREPCQWL